MSKDEEEYEEDDFWENAPIVIIENGSALTKIGTRYDNSPSHIFSTAVNVKSVPFAFHWKINCFCVDFQKKRSSY